MFYFNAPTCGLRQNNEYIKLRFSKGSKKGIFAYHKNLVDGVNKEYEMEVNEFTTFIQILEALGFEKSEKIEKKKILFLKKYSYFSILVMEQYD
jgi:predicted adenylyl cyclase CyaB